LESTNLDTQANITLAIESLNAQIQQMKEERATELCTDFEKLPVMLMANCSQYSILVAMLYRGMWV
jgi:hypothetical protein